MSKTSVHSSLGCRPVRRTRKHHSNPNRHHSVCVIKYIIQSRSIVNMFVELLILVVTASLVWLYLHKRRLMRGLEHLPTVQWNLPIIGASYRFLFSDTEQIMTTLIQMSSETDTPSIFWFGPTLAFMISKPEDLKAVYTSPNCLSKPYVYEFFHGNGTGIFNSPAQVWKKDRRVINPTFNNRILQSFVPIFNEKVDILVDTLQANATDGRAFDVADNIFACTLEMVCGTTLGYDIDVQKNKESDFCEHLEILSTGVAERIAKVWLHPQWMYKLTKTYREESEHVAGIFRLARNVRVRKQAEFLANKKAAAKQQNGSIQAAVDDEHQNESVDTDANSSYVQDDFVERPPQLYVNEILKLADRGELSIDQDVLDEHLVTMIVGGNETSALTSSNVLLMLAMHPDVQQRCFFELRRVYGDDGKGGISDRTSTLELIGQLDYMEMVIKETMRLLPVGPFLGRVCEAPTEISNCTLPTGSLLIMCNYQTHRDKRIWGERANEFDPDNFLPELAAKRHPFAYVPFSGGPRNCVGIKYAWISVKIMLAGLLRKYQFKTDQKYADLRFKWDITLKLSKKHMVVVEKRK